jgi:hypothetical protein
MFLTALLFTSIAAPSFAELQNVVVGGQLRIRTVYWRNGFNMGSTTGFADPEVRIPGSLLTGRPIGDQRGGQNAMSFFDWTDGTPEIKTIDQRTTLHVQADLTDNVMAFIEFDNYANWGEDFRSNYLTGVDSRASTADDVEVFQAYIQADELFGQPLHARIGRQVLSFGSGWLVGDGSALPQFTGISFDAIRLTYSVDDFSVDAFWSKLAENSPMEEDGDVDFSGIYGSYKGIEGVSFDAYWFWLRDAKAITDSYSDVYDELYEYVFNENDYSVTNLHTIGLRAAGRFGAFDFDSEAAYQFGDASSVGSLFRPYSFGDDNAEFNSWAAHVDVGYNIDLTWRPRVSIGGAYIGGEDNRDISFSEWLNPFDAPEASVSFNRLFSNTVYSPVFDEIAQFSNFWTTFVGVGLKPTERLALDLKVAYYAAIDAFDLPVNATVGDYIVSIAGPLTFWTTPSSKDLGWETTLTASYRYTDDLSFEVGWHHLFTGDGLQDGNYCDFNGLQFTGGLDNKGADYIYAQTQLSF